MSRSMSKSSLLSAYRRCVPSADLVVASARHWRLVCRFPSLLYERCWEMVWNQTNVARRAPKPAGRQDIQNVPEGLPSSTPKTRKNVPHQDTALCPFTVGTNHEVHPTTVHMFLEGRFSELSTNVKSDGAELIAERHTLRLDPEVPRGVLAHASKLSRD